MNAYLYTWNPKKWKWTNLENCIYNTANNILYDFHWSCGGRKNISEGDFFFLMRLGVEPKGIIGFGLVTSQPFEKIHWDEEKAKLGKFTLRTNINFKFLQEIPLFSHSDLVESFPEFNWTPQGGGVLVPNEIFQNLFSKISKSI